MKRLIIIFFAIATLAAGAQTITVKDTTLRQDARINFLISTILPAIDKHFSEEMARQKIDGEVTAEAETQAFFVDLQQAVNKYAQAFIQVNTVQVDTAQIVEEFNALNEKIAALQSDPDIKYIEAIHEFKNIQERQAKLAKYYQQITATPSYPEWKQPLGAHDSYKKGDRVLYNGKVYETIIDANVWSPDVTGWREIVK